MQTHPTPPPPFSERQRQGPTTSSHHCGGDHGRWGRPQLRLRHQQSHHHQAEEQKGPTMREIRDTDMGAAITYLLLDLEGVDTEPDILDDGKKGPWTIFATAECAEQFKGKYGEAITMTFSETPIEFTITYGEIETKKGGPMDGRFLLLGAGLRPCAIKKN
eukprot:scaffold1398_cov118-Isochrysis_galbana.AAC.1